MFITPSFKKSLIVEQFQGNYLKRKKQTAPSAQNKIKLKFPDLSLEWKEIYSLPFTVAHDTKTREFQYKLLNNIVFTNEKLFRFKMIDSPLCAFCQTEVEPPEHLIFHCNVTKSFWQLLFSWISEQKVILPSLTLENVFFVFLCRRGLSCCKSYYFIS